MPSINEIVQQVRAHPGVAGADVVQLPDPDFAFAVSQVIPSALRDLAEEDVKGSTTRPYLMTDPETVTVTLDADGKADLTPLAIDDGVMLEFLHLGEIMHEDWEFPLSQVEHSGQGKLPSNYDFMHAHYWLTGMTLNARVDEEPLEGDLAFLVPRVPGLNTLNPQRTTRLVDRVVARLRGIPVPIPEKK